MTKEKKTLPPWLWVLSGVFYFAVILASVAGLPQIELASKTTNSTAITDTETAGKLNINTATVTQLRSLPGIGEVLAGRIVEYRQQHGPFARIEDLKQVAGIGDKKWEAICELISV